MIFQAKKSKVSSLISLISHLGIFLKYDKCQTVFSEKIARNQSSMK